MENAEIATKCSCRFLCDHFYSEVPMWSVVANPWWLALADCSSEDAVQAHRDGTSLSSEPGSEIYCVSCVWSSHSPASTIINCLFHVQHIWKPCCCRTNSLKFIHCLMICANQL